MKESKGSAASAVTASVHARRPTVLILDNSRLAAHVLADLLASQDVHPVICLDFTQLAEFTRVHQPAAIFLCDWFSNCCVADLLAHLRSLPATADLPIIITAHAENLERPLELLAHGADDCLFKPIRREEVAVCLKRFMRTKLPLKNSTTGVAAEVDEQWEQTAAALSQAERELDQLKQQLLRQELLCVELDASLEQATAAHQQLQSELSSQRLKAESLQAQLAAASAECSALQQQLQQSTHPLTGLRKDVCQTVEAALQQCIVAGADAVGDVHHKRQLRAEVNRAFLGASRKLLCICTDALVDDQSQTSSRPLVSRGAKSGNLLSVHPAHEQLLSQHGAIRSIAANDSAKQFLATADL